MADAPVTASKAKEDWVKVVNISGGATFTDKDGKEQKYPHQKVVFSYDGNEHVIDKEIGRMKRYLADHAVKKSYVIHQNRYLLKIVELPHDERTALYPSEVNDKLKAETESQKTEIESLKKENAELKEKIEKLEKKIEKLER